MIRRTLSALAALAALAPCALWIAWLLCYAMPSAPRGLATMRTCLDMSWIARLSPHFVPTCEGACDCGVSGSEPCALGLTTRGF